MPVVHCPCCEAPTEPIEIAIVDEIERARAIVDAIERIAGDWRDASDAIKRPVRVYIGPEDKRAFDHAWAEDDRVDGGAWASYREISPAFAEWCEGEGRIVPDSIEIWHDREIVHSIEID
jgi:hypothetical protein